MGWFSRAPTSLAFLAACASLASCSSSAAAAASAWCCLLRSSLCRARVHSGQVYLSDASASYTEDCVMASLQQLCMQWQWQWLAVTWPPCAQQLSPIALNSSPQMQMVKHAIQRGKT